MLAEILPAAITGIPWPKSMRWAYDRQSWVRPLRNIAAVLDGTLVPFEVELGSPAHPHRIASRNETFGHRFLGPQSFVVADFKSYKARLLARQVMLDPAERRHTIRKQAESLSRALTLSLRPDEAQLDEVVGLEWPVVLLGRIEAACRTPAAGGAGDGDEGASKCFALEDSHGRLAPPCIIVSNVETRDLHPTVVAGNERCCAQGWRMRSSSGIRIARPRWNRACRR